MGRLPYSGLQVLDSNGDPLGGAKMNWYEAGTTTPLDTYSDDGLSSANANPVVADGDGRFGPMYGSSSEYKYVLTDSSDVTIKTEDNIFASELVGSTIKRPQTPLDFGAIGDGVADEQSAISKAIAAAIAAGSSEVDLLGLTYRCDSLITMDSNITLRNGTLDFTNCTDDEYIRAQGTASNTPVALSADAAVGATSVLTADTSSVDVGDHILVYSGGDWDATSGSNVGQLVKVTAVTASTSISFFPALESAHTTANVAKYQVFAMEANCVLEDLVLNCDSSAAGDGHAILINRGHRIIVRDCVINDPKGSGVCVRLSDDVLIQGTKVVDSAADGILIQDTCNDVRMVQCGLFECPDGIDVGTKYQYDGVCRNILVDRCVIRDFSAVGVRLDTECQYVDVAGCTISSDGTAAADGVNSTCGWVTVRDCTVTDTDGSSIELGLGDLNKASEYRRIINNKLMDVASSIGITVTNANASPATVEKAIAVCGNEIGGGSTGAAVSMTLNKARNVLVADNQVHGRDVTVTGGVASQDTFCAFTNNTVYSGDVTLSDHYNLTASGNTVSGTVTVSAASWTLERGVIADNILDSLTLSLSFDGDHNVTVKGNAINSTGQCIVGTSIYAKSISVCGNVCASSHASSIPIALTGNGSNAIDAIVLVGNVITTPSAAYCAQTTNATAALADGNACVGYGTGRTTGFTAGDLVG